METAPEASRDAPPKKDKFLAKKKVEISSGWKERFQLRGRRGGARAAEYQGSCCARRKRGDTGRKRPHRPLLESL